MKNNFLDRLNPDQREAVLTIDSPLLIVAGAGSGKTSVITHKIAYLIQKKNLLPSQVLGVTFTNRAADEMKQRIHSLTGIPAHLFPVSTFHSLGLRILRESGHILGFNNQWHVIDEMDQKKIIERIAKENIDSYSNDFIDGCRKRINLAKMNLYYPNNRDPLDKMDFTEEEIHIFSLYYDFQQQNTVWDYEDLISFSVKLLQNHSGYRDKYREQFKYVVVDEFQDTNPNQYELIKLLAQEHKKITVVGDDDQAIYSWRGASIRFLFDFERDFPGNRIIKLEQNYRSTQPILDFANCIIESNSLRRRKSMWTEKKEGSLVFLLNSDSKEEEAEKVADLIYRIQSKHPEMSPVAVLYRINSQSLAFETEFLKRNIPFKILKGLRFFDRKEIKDCIALLKLTMNLYDDTAFFRVIDFLPLGIGQKTLGLLSRKSKETKKPLFFSLKCYFKEKFDARTIFQKIDQLSKNKTDIPISEILNQLLQESHFLDILDQKKEHGRILNIKELISFIEKWDRRNPKADFVDLLDRISLDSQETKPVKKVPVYLLTMHNAKGTEFPTVIVSGINATYMPFFLRNGYAELEEERRLFYVSTTRAIKHLIISTGSSKPSHFLWEIDSRLYKSVYASDELFEYLMPSKGETEAQESDQFLEHPVFGKGKIIKELKNQTYLIHFKEKGEMLIDTSVVKVNFL